MTPTATMTRTPAHTELHTGQSGSGDTVWMVCTVDDVTGAWRHVERFDTKAEAAHWMKWA